MKANHTPSKNATRRSFLKNGALLAVPLAAATAPAAIVAEDSLKSRLARLEDEAAIRNLHAAWLRQLNAATASDDGSGNTFQQSPSTSGEKLCGSWLQPRYKDRKIESASAAEAPAGSAISTAFPSGPKAAQAGAPAEILRRIALDHAAAPDAIEIAHDGHSASGRFHCVVEIETPIARDSTLAQMAHAQGSGFVRRTERRLLRVAYAKSSGAWSIASAEFTAV